MESASRKSAEVAAKATPKPADRAPSKPADRGPSKPADMATPADIATPEPADTATCKPVEMATPKPAVGSSDEITSNPAAHMAATPAVASSAPSAPRRRGERCRSGQGSRNGKDCDLVQRRTLRVTSRRRTVRWRSRLHWRAAGCRRSDWGFEGVDANRCSRSQRAWALTQPGQPARELQRQIRDPAVSNHGVPLCGSGGAAVTRR
jgi:hypothetical protein